MVTLLPISGYVLKKKISAKRKTLFIYSIVNEKTKLIFSFCATLFIFSLPNEIPSSISTYTRAFIRERIIKLARKDYLIEKANLGLLFHEIMWQILKHEFCRNISSSIRLLIFEEWFQNPILHIMLYGNNEV